MKLVLYPQKNKIQCISRPCSIQYIILNINTFNLLNFIIYSRLYLFLFCDEKIKRFKIQFSQSYQYCKNIIDNNLFIDNETPTRNKYNFVFP